MYQPSHFYSLQIFYYHVQIIWLFLYTIDLHPGVELGWKETKGEKRARRKEGDIRGEPLHMHSMQSRFSLPCNITDAAPPLALEA